MALRAGYQGFKKLLPGLKLFRPGCLGIDNSELSKTFFPRSEQTVYGAYNVIPYPYDGGGATQTVTLTSDDDGVMSLNGTVTGGNMRYDLTNSSGNANLAKLRGTWKLTVEGALPANAVINIRKSNEAAVWSCAGNSEITIDFTDSVHTTGWIYLYAPTGTQFSNNTIKVMLSKNGGAFVPYAMPNKELTDVAEGLKLGDSIDLSQIPFSGFISSGTAEVTFLIPLKNSLTSNSMPISFNNATVNIRGIKGYLKDENGNDINADFNMTGKLTMAVSFRNSEFIRVVIKNTNSGAFLNVDNNTPVNIQFGSNSIFTFS